MKENGKTTQPVNTGAANIGNGVPALALNEAAGGIYTPDGKTPGGGKSGERSDRAKNKSARGREKAVHLLLKPQRRSNCHTARGREKAGQISEEAPCCARTAQNGAARLRCFTRSSALSREGTFVVSLCAGCPPVEIR